MSYRTYANAGAVHWIPSFRKKQRFSSRMIIDACRPFKWMKDFRPAAEIDANFQKVVTEKWNKELFS
jgi:hypothetical protein